MYRYYEIKMHKWYKRFAKMNRIIRKLYILKWKFLYILILLFTAHLTFPMCGAKSTKHIRFTSCMST